MRMNMVREEIAPTECLNSSATWGGCCRSRCPYFLLTSLRSADLMLSVGKLNELPDSIWLLPCAIRVTWNRPFFFLTDCCCGPTSAIFQFLSLLLRQKELRFVQFGTWFETLYDPMLVWKHGHAQIIQWNMPVLFGYLWLRFLADFNLHWSSVSGHSLS